MPTCSTEYRRHKIEQGPPVSEPVTFRNDGDVFDLQNAIALIRYHAFGFHAIIVKHIHDATLKISAHHALLFIGEEGNASYHRLSL